MNIEQAINAAFYDVNDPCVLITSEDVIQSYFLNNSKQNKMMEYRLRADGKWGAWGPYDAARPETGCLTEEKVKKHFGLIKSEGMEGFIEQATGDDGINENNLWENMKPIVPGLIIAVLFAFAVLVVERLVNKTSKGKAGE